MMLQRSGLFGSETLYCYLLILLTQMQVVLNEDWWQKVQRKQLNKPKRGVCAHYAKLLC